MRHAKATLKLPISCITVNLPNDVENETKEVTEGIVLDNVDNEQSDSFTSKNEENGKIFSTDLDEKDNEAILPTPSCTGSMDSLDSSSNSSLTSDRANNKQKETDNKNCALADTTLLDVISYVTIDKDQKNLTNEKLSQRFLSARLSDSTDEDSGIENLIRISNPK